MAGPGPSEIGLNYKGTHPPVFQDDSNVKKEKKPDLHFDGVFETAKTKITDRTQ